MQNLARKARTTHGAALQLVDTAKTRAAQLREEPEAGFDDLPWKMILMVGGVVLATAIVVAVTAYMSSKLGELK